MHENSTNVDTSSLIITLQNVNIHVMIWTGSFLLLAGNIGCIGNLLVFRSDTYRRQACFIYLFWETMASFFILDCILLTRILESGFQISLMLASDTFCRIREFISLFMYQNENTLFVFATLDRILSAQRSISNLFLNHEQYNSSFLCRIATMEQSCFIGLQNNYGKCSCLVSGFQSSVSALY